MGQCNYYVKARFASAREAELAMPRLEALLIEGEAAYEFWQSARPHQALGNPNFKAFTAEAFWERFREAFPLVWTYLGRLGGRKDWDNGLAGHLSLRDPRPTGRHQAGASLFRVEDLLFLTLIDVWHCSSTSLLERYVRDQLGAVAVGSVSEEQFSDVDREDEDFDAFLAIRV